VKAYNVPGDVLFFLEPNGEVTAETASGLRERVSLPQAAALALARAEGAIGLAEESLIERLQKTGMEGSWKVAIEDLVRRGLLVATGQVQPAVRSETPVFGIGAGGSGGEVLRRVLGEHPRICCPPATPLLSVLAGAIRGDTAADLWWLRLGYAWNRAALRAMSEEILTRLTRAAGKSRWIQFFAPGHLLDLGALDDMFGARALYVVPVKHGLDFVHDAYRELNIDYEELSEGQPLEWGFAEALKPFGGCGPEALAKYWVKSNQDALELKERSPERVLVVRHEDLTLQGNKSLIPVLSFLGELPHDGLKKAAQQLAEGPAPAGSLWKGWPPHVLKNVVAIVNDTLRALGYAPVKL
jgi:hypothetical protein